MGTPNNTNRRHDPPKKQLHFDAKIVHRVAHAQPGRLRLRIPQFAKAPKLMAGGRLYFTRIHGVTRATTNSWCGSITVFYDGQQIDASRLLDCLEKTTVGEIIGLGDQADGAHSHPDVSTSAPLKWASIGLVAIIALAGGGTIARLLAYVLIILIAMPVYSSAYQCLIRERRFKFESLNALAVTIGLLVGDLVTTAVMIWLISMGNRLNDIIASKSDCWINRRLSPPGEDLKADNGNNRRIRVVTGLTTLAVGIVMLPLPGPGIVIIPMGLGMLAGEFSWAAKWEAWLNGGAAAAN